jgi:hypothetical protein
VNILFFMRHPGYARNFDSTLRLLAERRHHVHLAFDTAAAGYQQAASGDDSRQGDPVTGNTGASTGKVARPTLVDRLCREYPNITSGPAPDREADGWALLRRRLRLAIDYLRYLEPRYRDAAKLRARAERRTSEIVRRVVGWPFFRTTFGLRVLSRTLRLVEGAIPSRPAVDAFIRAQRPDLVLVTPLVELGSGQVDYVRATKALGVPTGLCVSSWDNLTNKGLIQEIPDLVTVWNEAMKREAVDLHGVPAERVVVTGAQAYDHWFAWAPSSSREEFCRRVGLRDDRPFVLYLCSSPFIAPKEDRFVAGWVEWLRAAGDERLREAGVLIRPHPQNATQWRDVDLSGLGEAAVWPRAGADPVDAQAKADYYDSIYHSAAVVGVNTSALIESAIVGRPVHTLLGPEFRDTQEGTLHFHHLVQGNGGPLRVAATVEEHMAQLSEALGADGRTDGRSRRFLEAFVRPHGLGEAATPRVVEAIERAGGGVESRPFRTPVSATLLRPLLLLGVLYTLRRRWQRYARPQQVARVGRRLRRRSQRYVRPQQVARVGRHLRRRWQRYARLQQVARVGRRLRRRWHHLRVGRKAQSLMVVGLRRAGQVRPARWTTARGGLQGPRSVTSQPAADLARAKHNGRVGRYPHLTSKVPSLQDGPRHPQVQENLVGHGGSVWDDSNSETG